MPGHACSARRRRSSVRDLPVNPAASLEVEDLDAALAGARAAGLEILYGPADEEWGVRRFFYRDHDGNVVNVLTHL